MAEPTETITAQTVGAPEVEPVEIGLCAGCDQPIFSGDGVVIDKQRDRWHPDCRSVELRKTKPVKRSQGAAA